MAVLAKEVGITLTTRGRHREPARRSDLYTRLSGCTGQSGDSSGSCCGVQKGGDRGLARVAVVGRQRIPDLAGREK